MHTKKHWKMKAATRLKVSCVGGGQLGRMMALEAPRLNIEMKFIDPTGETSPAALVCGKERVIEGKLDDETGLRKLSEGCDVLTFEIEHVGVDALEKLESEGVNVQPSTRIVRLIQDKLTQKLHFQKSGIPLPPFMDVPDVEGMKAAAEAFGLPLMVKSRKGGYDGRGNAVLKSLEEADILDCVSQLSGKSTGAIEDIPALMLYAEGWINFQSEVAVMVVRSVTGECKTYPTVTAAQKDSICRAVLAPTSCPEAEEVAKKSIESLGDGASGVFGVELFLCKDGSVLLNEIAPRPHNTGHYTQDGCAISQFEHHLRAISGMPLGDCSLTVGACAMVNVLGNSKDLDRTIVGINQSLTTARATPHWYGKGWRKGRKVGHINLTADSLAELEAPLRKIMECEELTYEETFPDRPIAPLVGIIMGSTSDLPCMQTAVEILKKFDVSCEVDIVSAHRTPDKLMSYSRNAASRGLQVIIAGAGGAAHLPGMVAAVTPLPVVGVPIKTSTLNGQDSLLSIVQMPRGIPVATVAIGNSTNAALLAVRILAATRPALRKKMEEYQESMANMVHDASEELTEIGSTAYLDKMGNKSTSVNV